MNWGQSEVTRPLLVQQISALLTALPLGVAHPQITAHASGALLGAVRAADLLNLLCQGLEGGVDLHVAVTHHVGVIGAEVATTVGIRGLLLDGLADEVNYTTGSSGWSSRSRRSRRTLFGDISRLQNVDSWRSPSGTEKCHSQQVPSLRCDHEVQGVQWVRGGRSCHPYQGSQRIQQVPMMGGATI